MQDILVEYLVPQKRMKFGTLKCQGLVQLSVKKQQLADDIEKYKIDVFAIQETHLKESGAETITSSSGKKYYLYYWGHKTKSVNGVGIITSIKSIVEFRPISDRIFQITAKMNNDCKIIIISSYAPREESCKKTPYLREYFHTELDSTIKKCKIKRHCQCWGRFQWQDWIWIQHLQYILGKYGKGEVNKNRYALLELAQSNNLKLTNSFFKHRKNSRRRWVDIDSKSGTVRKNPYRNQVDYVLKKKRTRYSSNKFKIIWRNKHEVRPQTCVSHSENEVAIHKDLRKENWKNRL